MRGRKPNPTSRRILEGNPARRPLNDREPEVPTSETIYASDLPAELIAAKPDLGGDDARAEWLRLAPLLFRARQVSDVDRSALIAVCLEWGRYMAASRNVTSMVVLTASGYPIPNPYIGIAKSALTACGRLWAELGLTPSSRSRVQALPDTGPSDPFAEFDHVDAHGQSH